MVIRVTRPVLRGTRVAASADNANDRRSGRVSDCSSARGDLVQVATPFSRTARISLRVHSFGQRQVARSHRGALLFGEWPLASPAPSAADRGEGVAPYNRLMPRPDRSRYKTTRRTLDSSEPVDQSTPAERIAMVWQLTRE